MKVIRIKKVCYGATDFCHLKETIMGESGWLWGAFFLECSIHSLISTQQNLTFIQCLSLQKVTLALLASLLLSGFFIVVVNSQQIVTVDKIHSLILSTKLSYYKYYYTFSSLALFWLAKSLQWIFEISPCDVNLQIIQ